MKLEQFDEAQGVVTVSMTVDDLAQLKAAVWAAGWSHDKLVWGDLDPLSVEQMETLANQVHRIEQEVDCYPLPDDDLRADDAPS